MSGKPAERHAAFLPRPGTVADCRARDLAGAVPRPIAYQRPGHWPTGGGTEFTRLDVTVQPKCGMAARFYNVGPDGRPDEDSLHAGLRVTAGGKWACTLWFGEHETRYNIHHATE